MELHLSALAKDDNICKFAIASQSIYCKLFKLLSSESSTYDEMILCNAQVCGRDMAAVLRKRTSLDTHAKVDVGSDDGFRLHNDQVSPTKFLRPSIRMMKVCSNCLPICHNAEG
jgi:hypothetical protein